MAGEEHFFANGTTALVGSLVALGCRESAVAVPATVCPSVVAAIYATGNRPLFVDIERERFGLCPDELASVLDRVSCVIAVHALGNPCRIAALQKLCNGRGVALIEDCAQAEGAQLDGRSVGDFGDVAIFSYGAGKILSLGGGGVARARAADVDRELASFAATLSAPQDEGCAEELAHLYKHLYNCFYPDRLTPHRSSFRPKLERAAAQALGRIEAAQREHIVQDRASLALIASERQRKAHRYAEILGDHRRVVVPPFVTGSVPWRFNVWLEPVLRDRVLRAWLAEGRNVSSWYPDITPFLEPQDFDRTTLENSRWLSRGILNLWLDPLTSDQEIEETALRLRASLDSM